MILGVILASIGIVTMNVIQRVGFIIVGSVVNLLAFDISTMLMIYVYSSQDF